MIKSIVCLLLVFVGPALLIILLFGMYLMYQWLFTVVGIPHASDAAWIALVVTAAVIVPTVMFVNDY